MQKPIDFDRIWLEDRGKEEVIPAKLSRTFQFQNQSQIWFRPQLNGEQIGVYVFASRNDYGSRWRAWAHKPTDEERKASEWKD